MASNSASVAAAFEPFESGSVSADGTISKLSGHLLHNTHSETAIAVPEPVRDGKPAKTPSK